MNTLWRVWFGDDSVVWAAEDAFTAKCMAQLWAWRATGVWHLATKVEVYQ